MATKPTHEQAQLHLQVFEMRREPRLREARDWFFANYHAETIEEAMKLAPPGTENGKFVMMVLSYWEQACSLLNYGLLHDDLFFRTSGEFFGTWERVRSHVSQAREMFKFPPHLANMEEAAKRYEKWTETNAPGHIEAMRNWMKQMRSNSAKAA